MIIIDGDTYDNFKNIFESLGGGKKTPIIYNNTGNTNGFFVLAIIVNSLITVRFLTNSKPSTFDTDFPQAVQGSSVGVV
jgi:hypothetical protein